MIAHLIKSVVLPGLACLGVMGLVVLAAQWWQTLGLCAAGVVLAGCVCYRAAGR